MTDVADPAVGPKKPTSRRVKRRNRGRRRISFWIGLALVVTGLGILGWLAWQIWGTNWVSQREIHHEVKLFKSNSAVGPAVLLEIPKIGLTVPINDGVTQDVLAKGVGLFLKTGPGKVTIGPGDVGNYALAGHRITHGQPFADMPSLRPGDKVYVITHATTYVYVLDTDPNKLIVPFTASWVLGMDPINPRGGPQAMQAPGAKIITLTTCSELFHTDNRMIAFGHLETSYKTDPANPTQVPQ